MPGAADRDEGQALVHDRPSANLQTVVPRRPLLDGLEPELVEGEPRRRHGDPPVGVAAEDPHPEPAGDELADDWEGGEGGVVPSADHVAAQHSTFQFSVLRNLKNLFFFFQSNETHDDNAPAVCPVVADLGHVGVQRRLDVRPVEVDLRVLRRAGVVARRLHDPSSLQHRYDADHHHHRVARKKKRKNAVLFPEMKGTHVFGEDPGGGAMDGDLPVGRRCRRRRARVGADGGVEAVHVDEAVDGEVLLERGVAGVGDVDHGEVALGLDVAVHPVGDDGVVPGVVDHARLVRLVVHERVPDHQAFEVDVALLGPRPVAVEDLLRQLRDVVPCRHACQCGWGMQNQLVSSSSSLISVDLSVSPVLI